MTVVMEKPSAQPGKEFAYDEWKTRGACHGAPTVKLETVTGQMVDHVLTVQDFYPGDENFTRGQSKARNLHIAMLRRTCASCPVLQECTELSKVEEWGFLAGYTEEERRRKRRLAAKAYTPSGPAPNAPKPIKPPPT